MRTKILCIVALVIAAVLPSGTEAQNFVGLESAIAKQLQANGVPGASIAIILGDRIVWANGVGLAEVGTKRRIQADTLFQAASISKPVAAFGALRLVQDGKLRLDIPVQRYVTTAQIPAARVVTLRQLLSHTSGLSVHGFGGYRTGRDIPTLQQILSGIRPANSGAVILKGRPGTEYKYSGGGYCVVQQIVIDVSDKSFPEAMRSLVLSPVQMKSSTYEQPLSEKLAARAATAHDSRMRPVIGKWHVYPEMAAAGLWTTASDLARFIIALQTAYSGGERTQLNPRVAQEMLTAQVRGGPGLGLFVSGDIRSGSFSHTGVNNGFKCKIIATKRLGSGLVIMTNGDNGDKVYDSIQGIVRSALAR